MAEAGRVGADWRLSDLLGPAADQAARAIEPTVRFLIRRSHGKNPFVREREEDLVQTILQSAVGQAEKIRRGSAEEPRNLDAWLCRVTLNAIKKGWRDDRIGKATDDDVETAVLPAPMPLAPELRLTMRRALAALDPICRTLLLRREVAGESRESLATWLNLTTNAVGVRLHRCRKRLLELFEDGAAGAAQPSGAI